jgi:hypothetical protein
MHFELAVVGALECLADSLRQVDIGGRGMHPPGIFVELHDPIQRVFFTLVLRYIADEVDKLNLMRMNKAAFQRDLTCRKLVADALTGRTKRDVAGFRLAFPLPTAMMEYGPAGTAPRWFGVLSRNLVRIVRLRVEDAVTISGDASRWGLRCWERFPSRHLFIPDNTKLHANPVTSPAR